ncbi:sporulation thiol-disulfide oxidoreductase A precursor [Mariprofundus micogutta]|uniref:Sporulation thiol-disulfide oxidoreductase A n=1 Tax=Mariprofundus micogutta TaxID=1921010 RepID=A0A1L8CQW9_9PROT|nr:TlpA disulfide reductase family protein [Mariprofundus micogutta]GAV21311.1 sporulation thiol-disulfide oxidoreductase A precursor [Mariprofundus micogutta]
MQYRFIYIFIMFMTFIPVQAHAFSFTDLVGGSKSESVAFKWQDLDGKSYNMAQHAGKPVLIHLWASWCPACRDEMPAFTNWLNQHPEVIAIPVSLDRNGKDAVDFLKANNLEMTVLLSDEVQARNLGARALPTTIVVAADGTIKRHYRGAHNWADENLSKQLLNELQP